VNVHDKHNEVLDRITKQMFGPDAELAGAMGSPIQPGEVQIIVDGHPIGIGETFSEALGTAQAAASDRWGRPTVAARQVEQEIRRETAYHEAGHASMIWFFGTCSNLNHIDMTGGDSCRAFVQTRGECYRSIVKAGAGSTDASKRQLARLSARKHIMRKLSGPAAERIAIEGGLAPNFDDLYELWTDDPVDDADVVEAIEVAQMLYGETDRAWQLLSTVASWLGEALANVQFWGVVEALAERLMTVDRLAGEDAIDIMSKAWGEEPLVGAAWMMGTKWRRRFYITTQPA